MPKKPLISALCATALLFGAAGAAHASPFFTIVGGSMHEVTDPGGTSYPGNDPSNPVSNDAGLPTTLGGWPTPANGFPAGLPSGISTWVNSYLEIGGVGTTPISLNIGFQYMGHGDASQNDSFEVFNGSSWTTLFTNTGCGANGCLAPVTMTLAGLADGSLIPFRYDFPLATGGTGLVVNNPNDPNNNATLDPNGPNFVLGVDPYLASGTFDTAGAVVFAGLTDRAEDPTDHQDLGVRITVPEPGTLALLGIGLLGFAPLLRRRMGAVA